VVLSGKRQNDLNKYHLQTGNGPAQSTYEAFSLSTREAFPFSTREPFTFVIRQLPHSRGGGVEANSSPRRQRHRGGLISIEAAAAANMARSKRGHNARTQARNSRGQFCSEPRVRFIYSDSESDYDSNLVTPAPTLTMAKTKKKVTFFFYVHLMFLGWHFTTSM
jgi:hypothetical protein